MLVEAKVHEAAMDYVKMINQVHLTNMLKALNDPQTQPFAKRQLLMIQSVMKMIRNLHEGVHNNVKQRVSITKRVLEMKPVFDSAECVLDDDQFRDDGELAVIIVNLIICFNALTHIVDTSQLKRWLADFSGRFKSAADSFGQGSNEKWFMTKYIFICEQLVSRYMEHITQDMVVCLLAIY